VRLASYENQQEADYLVGLYQGRSGLLNNTTFALLAPDGKTLLAPPGRGPEFTLGKRGNPNTPAPAADTAAFAQLLRSLAEPFPSKKKLAALPQARNLRLALNIAACDNQPLLIAYAADAENRASLQAQLTKLAWSEDYVGRMQYLVLDQAVDPAIFPDLPEQDYLALIQPGDFGLDGSVLIVVDAAKAKTALAPALDKGLQAFHRESMSRQQHASRGRRAGADWETVLPVTDEGAPRRSGRPSRD